MDTSAKSDVDDTGARRASRRMRTLQEKLAIVEEASRPGASIALVARRHDVNANLVFGWLRLQRRGLLERQRHGKAPPLLPVKLITPTLTPSEPNSARVVKRRARRSITELGSTESMLEIVLAEGTRLRLRGEAQQAVLERVLEWLPRR